ncbi:MAG: NAD-dependent epimerase/dehydratase family protein [Natronomonas sp.]
MTHALVIGGTRFLGRHVVSHLLDSGYDVTLFNRGEHDNPFGDRVEHREGDRTVEGELRRAALVDPDVVVDCVAYRPKDVRVAADVFADVEAYVYISSAAAYSETRTPARESEAPLCACTTQQALDDSAGSYGPRKAEGDRAVSAAADRGIRAMSIRPPIVYGPHDYTGRFGYWIDRVADYDRIVVPAETALGHLAFAEDVATAVRVVAESGTAGAAYNVGDGHAPSLTEWIDRIGAALGTDIEVVTASRRELAAVDVDPAAFPLYRTEPLLLSTERLRDLGWRSTPLEEALETTIAARDRGDGTDGPDRPTIERLLDVLETVG